MCAKRRLAAFLLVLLVASCYVWAFPGRKESKAVSIQEEPVPATQASTAIDPTSDGSEQAIDLPEPPKSSRASEIESDVISKLESKSTVKGDELAELIGLLKAQVEDQLEAEEDIARLASKVDELQEANQAQADEIAYQKGLLDKEQSVKAFAQAKALIGFEDNAPAYGIGGEIGLRTGKGLMLSTGASYMLGTFTSPLELGWDLDNLSLSVGIGWEW